MKKKLLIISLLAVFIFVNKVDAAGNVSISCSPSTLKTGETSECTIKGTYDSKIDSIQAKVNVSSNLTIEEVTIDTNYWQGEDLNGGNISIYREDQVSGTFEIAKVKIKAASGISNDYITVNNIMFYNSDSASNEYAIENASAEIKAYVEDSKEDDNSKGNDNSKEDDSSQGNDNSKSNNEISNSPKTGNVMYIIIAIVLVISLGASIYFMKNKNKKEK